MMKRLWLGFGSDRVERAAWGQLVEESFADVKGNRGRLSDGNYGAQNRRHCYS